MLDGVKSLLRKHLDLWGWVCWYWHIVVKPSKTCGLFLIEVSWNGGSPKSSNLIGFSTINRQFWVVPIYGNFHMFKSMSICFKISDSISPIRTATAAISSPGRCETSCGYFGNRSGWNGRGRVPSSQLDFAKLNGCLECFHKKSRV